MAVMAAPMLAAVHICALAHSLSSRRFLLHVAQVHVFGLKLHTLDMCATGNISFHTFQVYYFLLHQPVHQYERSTPCVRVDTLSAGQAGYYNSCPSSSSSSSSRGSG
jgi:hypothetical protein